MKSPVSERAQLLFEMRDGEVTNMELVTNFNDEEIHHLFMKNYIKPTGDATRPIWHWIKSQVLQQ